MVEVSETDLQEAVERVSHDIVEGGYRVEWGRERGFHRRVRSIRGEIGIDPKDHRMSDGKLHTIIKDILITLGGEQHESDEELDMLSRFSELVDEKFSEVFGSPLEEFTVVLPLNIQTGQGGFGVPIHVGRSQLVEIEYDEWVSEYLNPALESEESNFSEFYETAPNEPDRFSWSVWTMKVDARDPHYAVWEVSKDMEIFFAEVNFEVYRGGTSMPLSSPRNPPRERWSKFEPPYLYLTFLNSEFERYLGSDYKLRRPDSTAKFADIELEDLPQFHRKDQLDDFQVTVASALLAFQDGITETSHRKSFFSFWRGVEILTPGPSSDDHWDQAKFAYRWVNDREPGERTHRLAEAMEEVPTARNDLAHQGPSADVSRQHQEATKIFLDSLLELFLDNMGELELDEMELLLEYGTKSMEETEKISHILTRLIEERE